MMALDTIIENLNLMLSMRFVPGSAIENTIQREYHSKTIQMINNDQAEQMKKICVNPSVSDPETHSIGFQDPDTDTGV
jgi:hypothetical protein